MKTLSATFVSLLSLTGIAAAEDFWVTTFHSRLHTTEAPIASVVVGDPSVADITVKSNTEVLIFGRAPGATNLTMFGPDGSLIDVLEISVRNSSANRVILQSGDYRYSFNCTDICEQTPTIGDGSNATRLLAAPVIGQADESLTFNQKSGEASTNGQRRDPSGPGVVTTPERDSDGRPSS